MTVARSKSSAPSIRPCELSRRRLRRESCTDALPPCSSPGDGVSVFLGSGAVCVCVVPSACTRAGLRLLDSWLQGAAEGTVAAPTAAVADSSGASWRCCAVLDLLCDFRSGTAIVTPDTEAEGTGLLASPCVASRETDGQGDLLGSLCDACRLSLVAWQSSTSRETGAKPCRGCCCTCCGDWPTPDCCSECCDSCAAICWASICPR